VKRRIFSLVLVLLLLATMIGGCSTSGSSSLNDVLKILPDNVNNLFAAEWGKIRADANLQELWAAYSQKMNTSSMEQYLGVNSEDVELLAMASGTSVYYIILKGKFDLTKIRPVLETQKLKRLDDYLRTEMWSGEVSVAFIRDMMVVTVSIDGLKTMIRLHEGEEKDSFYNHKDFNSVINKLPAGIFTLIASGGGHNATSTGMSFSTLPPGSLSFSQWYLYADNAAAGLGKTDLENAVSSNFTGNIDSVNQKNNLVEVKGSMTIVDFMKSAYFTNMGI
jgi:hypothetical protein